MVREAEALEKAAAADNASEEKNNKPRTKEEIAEAMRKMHL